MMKTTGNFHIMAILKVSCNAPCRTAPSPMDTKATFFVPLYFSAKPTPAPMAICAPTIPCPPMKFLDLSKKCIDPPLPFEHPVFRP